MMLVATLAAPVIASAASPAPTEEAEPTLEVKAGLRQAQAETKKAEAETKKAEDDDGWGWRALPFFGPFLTALAAVVGLFLTVRKAGTDRRDAFEREARERADTRESTEVERFDERFAKAASGLSSASPGEQSGAAVLVASMVREKREALSDQALQLLLVSLQTPHDEACERLLRSALERFTQAAPYRVVGSRGQATGGFAHLNTSYLKLPGLELPGLDLAFATLRKAEFHGANLSGCLGYEARLEEADFRRANLPGAQWVRAQARGARFQQATLTRARLHQADLSDAKFYRTDLRRANLRQAVLVGAQFEGATLEKADFHGAVFDEKALQSILKAEDWRSAKFDSAVESRLLDLAK